MLAWNTVYSSLLANSLIFLFFRIVGILRREFKNPLSSEIPILQRNPLNLYLINNLEGIYGRFFLA